ncbi:transglutaminase [Jeotgalibacillus soli]|uniref:Transglutaminase n=1 Tax=Jeotgalibacillus soli TaxID=889306 RepID=A0A0C2S5D5_9BACL|nr:transglutaminase [Jeotgalibacillus soli]
MQSLNTQLFHPYQTKIQKAQAAFEYIRDEISHLRDIQGTRVTRKASDVIKYREGICYAKSNVLAALLCSQGIPAGYCYQRLMIFDTPEKGYSIHALNAVFLKEVNKWVRLDARGNKPGIDAQFQFMKKSCLFRFSQNMMKRIILSFM